MSHVLSSFGDSFLGGSSGTVALSHLIRVLFIGLELPRASEAVNGAETMEKDFPEATFLCKGLALPFFFRRFFLSCGHYHHVLAIAHRSGSTGDRVELSFTIGPASMVW